MTMEPELAGAPCKSRTSATGRLVLRAPADADLVRVYAIHADPQNNRYNPAGPMRDRDQARVLLDAWMGQWSRLGYGPWAVALAGAPERVIGFGGIGPRHYGAVERINLGYRFEAAAWGAGLATELARTALAVAFGELDLVQVHALVRPAHAASIRVLEKAGMERAGTLDDVPGQPHSLVFVARAPR